MAQNYKNCAMILMLLFFLLQLTTMRRKYKELKDLPTGSAAPVLSKIDQEILSVMSLEETAEPSWTGSSNRGIRGQFSQSVITKKKKSYGNVAHEIK